jgi:hypothetical protein
MTMRDTAPHSGAHRRARSGPTLEYRLLYALGFSIFLVIAVVRRILPLDRLFRGAPRPQRGIVREARETTSATIPYAFMG